MSRIENLNAEEQVLVLKDILNDLQKIRAYIQGTGSEEYKRECEIMYRRIAHVITSIEEKKE